MLESTIPLVFKSSNGHLNSWQMLISVHQCQSLNKKAKDCHNAVLTAFYFYVTELSVHREVLQVHRTGGGDR